MNPGFDNFRVAFSHYSENHCWILRIEVFIYYSYIPKFLPYTMCTKRACFSLHNVSRLRMQTVLPEMFCYVLLRRDKEKSCKNKPPCIWFVCVCVFVYVYACVYADVLFIFTHVCVFYRRFSHDIVATICLTVDRVECALALDISFITVIY